MIISTSYLSDNTRKIRRWLLLVCLIGYSISKLDLTLTEIHVFGSKFEMLNYTAIPFVLIIVILYFLITYAFYSLSEYSHGHWTEAADVVERHVQGKTRSPFDISVKMDGIRRDIDNIQEQITNREYYELDARAVAGLEKALEERKIENKKLLEFFINATSRIPLVAQYSWGHLRTFVEMVLPMLVAMYAIVHLAYFTEISNPNLKGDAVGSGTVQSDSIAVVTETPATVDTTEIITAD